MNFTVVLLADAEDGGYTAVVPALPGCVSEGETLDETFAMIKDAATGYLAVLAERGEEIPEETFGTIVAEIDVPLPASAEAIA